MRRIQNMVRWDRMETQYGSGKAAKKYNGGFLKLIRLAR